MQLTAVVREQRPSFLIEFCLYSSSFLDVFHSPWIMDDIKYNLAGLLITYSKGGYISGALIFACVCPPNYPINIVIIWLYSTSVIT